MGNNAGIVDPIAELRLVAKPAPDRLPAMLFLAALIHGVLIIGIAFNPALSDQFADAISLEVTIVAETDQNIDRPNQAEYLAQASQEGGGNTTEQVRPSALERSDSPLDNIGVQDGDSFTDSTAHEAAADELVASERLDDRTVTDRPRETPVNEDSVALALERGSDTTLPLPRADDATLLIHDDEPRQLVVSADTRESNVALYLDNWKGRIEAVGDEYFPQFAELDDVVGSPTLEVSISSNGELAEVIIRRSSGSAVIDQAALDILRRASPFDPFPNEIANDYDTLRFAYKWLFTQDVIAAQAAAN